MEGFVVFLPILCSFLNVFLTSACYFDYDCYYEARCCKRYEDSGGGVCVYRSTCFGFCVQLNDCSAPEICDTSRNLCTTECTDTTQCHDGYICNYEHCESDDSSFNVNTLFIVVGLIVGTIFVICCCMHHRRRRLPRGANANANVNTTSRIASTNRTSRGTHAQQNGDTGTPESPGLEMNSSVPAEPQQDEESNDQIPDAIAEGGPPSYVEANRQPELPPPTYEEVMRASHEILPQSANSHV